MITKKYRAINSKYLSLSIKLADKYKRINFIPGNKTPMDQYAWYETSDKELIAGIENNKYMNILYKVESVKGEEDKVNDDVVYDNITTLDEAKAILMSEPYKCTKLSLNNTEKFQNKCKENKVSFPNLVM
jgi:hypothetical protein